MHIQDPEERRWIQDRIERQLREAVAGGAEAHPEPAQRGRGVRDLPADASTSGQKRFSLEGGESLIPLLDEVLQTVAEGGLDEVVIGMAHRGRLNVLANIVGKPYEKIFSEFEGHLDPKSAQGSGDVKYHLGQNGKFTTPDGEHAITVGVVANPSHLEAVDPVLEGIVRAKQDRIDLKLRGLHRAAAGWSTATRRSPARAWSPRRSTCPSCAATAPAAPCTWWSTTRSASPPPRSTPARRSYSTDVARMIQAPIFHVNGDDPEAVVRVGPAGLRVPPGVQQGRGDRPGLLPPARPQRGRRPVDDQPADVRRSSTGKRSVRKLYTEELIGRGDITVERGRGAAPRLPGPARAGVQGDPRRGADRRTWPARESGQEDEPEPAVETAVADRGGCARSARRTSTLPEGFTPHKRLASSCSSGGRKMSVEGDIDWGFGEILAFGSLVDRGRHRAAGRPGLAPRHVRAAARLRSSTPTPARTTCR